jgi:hypothetical protein
MYSSYSFFTSALDGGEWSVSRPSRALAPGRVLVPTGAIVSLTLSSEESCSYHICLPPRLSNRRRAVGATGS